MPKTFLFHKTNPQGQAFELDDEMAQRLEAEGWVDSPDKLGDHAPRDPDVRHDVEVQSGKAIPRNTPVNLTTGSGSEIGKTPIFNSGPVSILASDEAKERFGKLWDPDGVPLYGALKNEELGRIVDAMSVDEIKQAIEFAGLGTNDLGPEQWTSMLRGRLAEALRPNIIRGGGETPLNDNPSHVDEAVARAKAQPGETIPPTVSDSRPDLPGNQGGDGSGAGTVEADDMVETYGTLKPVREAEDTENGSNASDPTRSNTGNTDGTTESTTPTPENETRAVDTATPERRDEELEHQPVKGGPITVEELDKLDEHGREDWLTHDDTTKEHLRAILTAKGKTPKARDGKEEMQEAIRLAYAG